MSLFFAPQQLSRGGKGNRLVAPDSLLSFSPEMHDLRPSLSLTDYAETADC